MTKQHTVVVGMDLGDKRSRIHVLNTRTGEIEEREIETSAQGMEETFSAMPPALVAFEAGTHCLWVERLVSKFGHKTIIANPRILKLIYKSHKKNDITDAEKLAKLAAFNPDLLSPITPRCQEGQVALAVIRSRDAAVRARAMFVNHVRGTVKAFGGCLAKCTTKGFAEKALPAIPQELRPALLPMLNLIAGVNVQIRKYDKAIDQLNEKFTATSRLRQVTGVGPITALAFVLVIGNPGRFKKSREVGPYLGLVPRCDQSGDRDPELHITKAGDMLMRRLLVQSSQYILGRFGPDTDLKAWGLALASRGRKNAKKRAVVATARKLAVLLHRLWVSGKPYEPTRNSKRRSSRQSPAPDAVASVGTAPAA